MPELPEVETVKLGLKKLLPGRKIIGITYDWPKSFPNTKIDADNFLIDAKIIDVRRRAKVLMIDLSSGYSLVIHLKMTGQLVYRGSETFGAGHPNDSLIGKLPDKSTRVTIDFIDGNKLFFNDQRKFGWMRLIPTAEIMDIDFMKKIGPEPLESNFSSNVLIERLKKRKKAKIKPTLLDQTVIAGIGNIYADESLFCAGIHPASLVGAIPQTKLVKLHSCLVNVLKLSIEKGGSTDKNYVNAEGKKGSYIECAKVFRKENLPCPKCKHEIIKIRVAGRGTHLCEKCQKTYTGNE
jgi:formamidopyrimidine-DNA glycosylase